MDIHRSTLPKLCAFGSGLGQRLNRLSSWVDGMPSSVKSLGFEIWSTSEVLNELENVLARSQRQSRGVIFDETAMVELSESIEVCDEVFHEAARGVLVADQRLKVLRPLSYSEAERSGELVDLSFHERVRWPLFQKRISNMVEVLLNAKMDILLHILVYWTMWEHQNRRRSRASLFNRLEPRDREVIIGKLWRQQVRRDGEMPGRTTSNRSNGTASTLSSNQSSSRAGSRTPSTASSTTSPAPSRGREKSNLFKRIGRRLERSLEMIGVRSRSSSAREAWSPGQDRPGSAFGHLRGELLRSNSRAISSRSDSRRSDRSEHSSPAANYVADSHSPGLVRQHSLLSMTTSSSRRRWPDSPTPGLARCASWSAGPTRSAKEGILREWQMLQTSPDDSMWNMSVGAGDPQQSPREGGRTLLFAQLHAMAPGPGRRDLQQDRIVIDMLVQRWTGLGNGLNRAAGGDNAMRGQLREDGEGGDRSAEKPNKFLF